MTFSHRVQVILPMELYDQLQKYAKIRKRSVSAMATFIIEEFLTTEKVQERIRIYDLKNRISDERIKEVLREVIIDTHKLEHLVKVLEDEPCECV